MKIERVIFHTEDELICNMRQVGTLENSSDKVYKNSVIELAVSDTADIIPAQRYVQRRDIEKINNLATALKEHCVNLFELDGYITFYVKGLDVPFDLLPPVVEESVESSGKRIKILNDGMHRIYLARSLKKNVKIVYISNIPSEFPYYAYPLPNGWTDVEIVENLPPSYVKKWHRIENYASLYRDFNTVFQNVGAPRKSNHNADG